MRFWTCVELGLNFQRYEHAVGSKLEAVSPTYFEAVINFSTPGHFSRTWQLAALANVIKRDVVSVYPGVNGALDWAA